MLSISSGMQIKCKIIHLIGTVRQAKHSLVPLKIHGFAVFTEPTSSPKHNFPNCKHVAFQSRLCLPQCRDGTFGGLPLLKLRLEATPSAQRTPKPTNNMHKQKTCNVCSTF
ncbi:hypothetical protein Zmor_002646 [Zophobas morio]|uniref:Uncharacterized protein n=1 Tax=Zophobas morio TaxID=2755281 RepID=A0AA38HL75_9CUCU|nr:hypothetical protein Zmor_002646 [Zophobas morio]